MNFGRKTFPAVLALSLLLACSDEVPAPTAALLDPPPPTDPLEALAPITRVPISQGDAWEFAVTYEVHYYDERGNDALPPVMRSATGNREIIGQESILAVSFVVEKETWQLDTGGVTTTWRRYRQDEGGFFRALVPITAPPGSPHGIDELDETRRLLYPVTDGTLWDTYKDPRGDVLSVVEGKEMVDTPAGPIAAYRILVHGDWEPDDTWTRIWFSDCGLIKRHYHTEFNALDLDTDQEYHVTVDEIELLSGATVAGGCAFPEPAAVSAFDAPGIKKGGALKRSSFSTRAFISGRVAHADDPMSAGRLEPLDEPGTAQHRMFSRTRAILTGDFSNRHEVF